MTTEFNLSEKIIDTNEVIDYCGIPVIDVKEFIRLLKEELFGCVDNWREVIDKLAGSKLIL